MQLAELEIRSPGSHLLQCCRPFTLHREGKQLQRGLGRDMGMKPPEMHAYVSSFFPVVPGKLGFSAAANVSRPLTCASTGLQGTGS